MRVNYNDPEANARLLEEMAEEAMPSFENEYVKLIERMRDLKVKEEVGDPERAASEAEVHKAMEDFVKETEDL